MNQQVNLFQPMFQRQRELLSGAVLVRVVLAVAIGLMGLYGYGAYEVERLEADVARLELQRDQATRRLAGLEQAVPTRARSADLMARVRDAVAALENRKALVEILDSGDGSAERGFSGFLEGLARQRVEGLWLTGLRIGEGGDRLEIAGSAVAPELVPALVRRLSSEPRFDQVSFRSLVIRRPDEEGTRIDFVLRSVPAGEDRS